MERSSGAVRKACDVQVDGRWGPGRPKLTWNELKKTTAVSGSLTLYKGRSAIHVASQLPRRGPTDVDDAHAPVR